MKVEKLWYWVVGLCLFGVGCQSASSPPSTVIAVTEVVTAVVTREVEVTKEVLFPIEQTVIVTQYATVQVPVEVTREVYIEVTPNPNLNTRTAPTLPPAPTVPTPTPTFTPMPERSGELGEETNPITLLFSPLYPERVTELRGRNLVTALEEETELTVEMVVAADHDDLLDQFCANEETTIAFMSNVEYILAYDECDGLIGFAGLRAGVPWQASMVVVPRGDDNYETLADLDGATWGVPSVNDLVNGLYFQALFEAEGIEPAEIIEYETDSRTMIANVDGEIEFGTASYLPPIMPFDDEQWQFGEDDPEEWLDRANAFPFRSGIGFIVVLGYVEYGGWQVRDARANAFDVRDRVFLDTEILQLSEQFPNDAVVYGNDVPSDIIELFDEALDTVTQSDDCTTHLCSTDFFDWEGVEVARNDEYDAIRFIQTELDLSRDELLETLR